MLADRMSCVPAKVVADGFMDSGQIERALSRRPAMAKEPLPPRGAYNCFDQNMREELIEHSSPWRLPTWRPLFVADPAEATSRARDITCEVGRRWKALSAEEKQHWQAESERDQKRYLAECAERGLQPKAFPHMAGQVRAARPDNEDGTGPVGKPRQHASRAGAPAPYSRLPGAAGPDSRAAGGKWAALAPIRVPFRLAGERPAGTKWNAKTKSFV